uniref:SFRICE_031202 n=1 Tax=Spodoptera frugiperda TaxID=7108 RepID=A0A2H1V5U0_SPOFR
MCDCQAKGLRKLSKTTI